MRKTKDKITDEDDRGKTMKRKTIMKAGDSKERLKLTVLEGEDSKVTLGQGGF